MLKYFAAYRGLIALLLLCLLIEAAYAVAAPLSLKYLVDEAFVPKDGGVFALILSLLIGAGLLSIAASLAGDYALGRVVGQGVAKLRLDLFERVQRQSISFYQRYGTGDLVSRFTTDTASVERAVGATVPMLFAQTLGAALGLVMLFALDWRLTLVMIAGASLMIVGPKLLQGRAEEGQERLKASQERFMDAIDETVKGHKTIRSLHQQARVGDAAARLVGDMLRNGLGLRLVTSWMERLPLISLMILNGLMIGLGGYLIFHDELTIGGFMAFFTLFLTVGQSGTNLTYLIPGIIEARVSFARIGEVMARESEVPEPADPRSPAAPIREIAMDGVTFGYGEGTDQLSGVSLSVAGGSYTAFVGSSGSGKSTALQLLARFYDPRQGQVVMDGFDLREIGERRLRELTLLVGQDTFLFNTTVRDNLLLGRGDLSEAEMIDAARRAGLQEAAARWPEGYDTVVRHEGGSFSGGERQRIALARALLRDPDVLLLDEVTAALDTVSEARVNELVLSLRGRKTVVSVTHRLSSVVQADRIYVFDRGEVVESGTHEQLLGQGGAYARLWDKQQGFTLSEDGLHADVDTSWLARLPFLTGIDTGLLNSLSAAFSTQTCREGEAIVREGEEGQTFYIIVRGKFEVTKQADDGGERRVATLQDGDYFGEIALMQEVPRTATVRALGPSVLLSMRRETFQRLLSGSPQVRDALTRALERRT
ncbi:ABC transporter transmembrane domain-containing protein [Cohnella sp. JJ-181]|uniref:ABC transporter transmembrane domain-containing protein n=1 Tax=Cohnella rhizoplanae TaxID=2974897 RepID=UPI0022FF71C7|nr:ABC transporter transmembrane domain-containing protein [Cohnella sp. JJ-181]CAI6080005.1 Vitamin B12 import ATP-binding protein BtuD [Cohnella sp. JJ-181]